MEADRKSEKRCGSIENEGTEGKKKRLADNLLNEALLQESFIKKISDIYKMGKPYNKDDESVEILIEPFHCCVIRNFIKDDEFLEQLKSDVLSLNFHEKSNDLYKFQQSDDLKSSDLPTIQKIRDVLYCDFLCWLQRVTGLDLSNTMDISCAKYNYTDSRLDYILEPKSILKSKSLSDAYALLCHDDELEGRRVAFIFYLVPPWEEQDGGTLDLFSVDVDGQPNEIRRVLTPKWNTLIFFEVTPISFHQVSEVVNKDKCRLSISGWFYGESVPRLVDKPDQKRIAEPPLQHQDDILLEWINPMYLSPEIVNSIQEQLEENSEIQLDEFLIEEKYNDVLRELEGSSLRWKRKGPANKRCYKTLADESAIPPNLSSLIDLMRSLPMFKLLTKLTGLKLAEFESEDEKQDNVMPSSSSELDDSELKSCCAFEVRHWSHGSYTLVHDTDPGLHEYALDAMLFFGCDDWDSSAGGFTTYVASGEDEELLTVCPTSNCLALVYRDKETVRFVKHVNASCKDMLLKNDNDAEKSKGFYDLSMVYYE